VPERPAPPADAWREFRTAAQGRRFDLAIQMYGALPAANAVTAQLAARLVGGFVTPGAYPADLATHLPYPFRAHEIDRHLRLVEFLGAPPGDRTLEFRLDDHDRAEAAAALGRTGPYAVVHPGSTAESRRWPRDRFAAIADGVARHGLAVVLTGVRAEKDLVAEVAARMRAPALDLAGRTSLGAAAAIVAGAAVVISNDTGIVPVAVARRTPTVTVYLAGDAERWRGLDRARHRAVAVDVGCNPCGLQRCPIDFRCATWLSPAQLLAEVDAVLTLQQDGAATRRSS
jgi:ADP-heptose:LPS heptosyltransferase